MKLQEKVNNVKRSGNFEEKKFRLAATGKAFDILSNSLYSNKVRAIIRELSCNAFDSHRETEKEKTQFEVHLPDATDRTFWIRDFGTGISEEDIYEIYTTYFESTKSDSDDFTGCLGLGSKTPFSYTDNFIVTSFFNGKKYVYSAFKSEDGQPAIAKLSEEDTKEPNGLEVKLGIKEEDFSTFYKEAGLVYTWFDPKPKFVGISAADIRVTKSIIGNSWFVKRGATEPAAVMGNILYPISIKELKDKIDDDTLVLLDKMNPTFEFPIGALDIAPSREHLQYQNKTIKAIELRVLSIKKDIEKEVSTKLNAAKNRWDAALELEKLFSGNYGSYIRHMAKTKGIDWNGKPLKLEYSHKDIFGTKPDALHPETYQIYYFDQVYSYMTGKYISKTARKNPYDFCHKIINTPKIKYIFVIRDGEREYSDRKMRLWMRDNIEDNKNTEFLVVMRNKNEQADFDKYIEVLGLTKNDNYFFWHELPAISRANAQKGAKKRKKTESKFIKIDEVNNFRINKVDMWKDYENVDLEEGSGIFVSRTNFSMIDDDGKEISAFDLLRAINNFNEIVPAKEKIKKLNSFTKLQLKSKGENWVNVLDYLYDNAKKLWTEEVQKEIYKQRVYQKNSNGNAAFNLKVGQEMTRVMPNLNSISEWKKQNFQKATSTIVLSEKTENIKLLIEKINSMIYVKTINKPKLELKTFDDVKNETVDEAKFINDVFKKYKLADQYINRQFSDWAKNYPQNYETRISSLFGFKEICEYVYLKEKNEEEKLKTEGEKK